MHLYQVRPGEHGMRFDPGDRLAVCTPVGPDVIGRVISPVVELLAGEREVHWPAEVIERGEGVDAIGCGWIADDSETVLAIWDVHRVGPGRVAYTLLVPPPAGA